MSAAKDAFIASVKRALDHDGVAEWMYRVEYAHALEEIRAHVVDLLAKARKSAVAETVLTVKTATRDSMTLDERDLAEGITRKLLGMIGPDTLEFLRSSGFGVTIFAFSFDPGAIAYISTADRADMLRSIKEWVAYQEAGLSTEPRGERGRS